MGLGINGSAWAHVSRQFLFIGLIYGYLYKLFKDAQV